MIDRSTVREILAECEAALRPVAEKHGLTLARKTCTFTAESIPVAFRMDATASRNGVELTTDEAAYVDRAALWGMEHVKLGAEIYIRGGSFTVVGAKPSSRKYPIIVKRTRDGKLFKMDVQSVRFGWRAANGDV